MSELYAAKAKSFVFVWLIVPLFSTLASAGIGIWLAISRPLAGPVLSLVEGVAFLGFLGGAMSLASVLGGKALLEQHSSAEPLRILEAGWLLSLPPGILAWLVLIIFRPEPYAGNFFTLFLRPLLICMAFFALLWAVLTRLLQKKVGLEREDYACALFLSPAQYTSLRRRKKAWIRAQKAETLTVEEARVYMPDIVLALAGQLHIPRKKKVFSHILDVMRSLNRKTVWEELTKALQAPQEQLARSAALAIGAMGLTEALPVLVQLAQTTPHKSVRIAAFQALGEIGTPEAFNLIEEALMDPAIVIREAACIALGKGSHPQALAALKQYHADPHPRVRKAVAAALKRWEKMSGHKKEA